MRYVQGLLAPLERKTGWQLAEALGDSSPAAMQDFLGRTRWDADAVRDDLQTYVIEYLSDDGAVLILDETGFIKKGDRSIGVKRQYSGTAGRIENCQVGVFLGYASRRGRVLVDRTLHLPEEWDRAGPSSPASRPPRARSSSTNMRFGRGRDGAGTSRWPCWLWPSSPSCARRPLGGEDRLDLTADLLPLTVPEIRTLLAALAGRQLLPTVAVAWSIWRRRHQQRTRWSHWKRRTQTDRDRL